MPQKRKGISKTLRFDVFKRDNFTCQYCSRKSPDVVLEVDHIVPISKSGNNDIENLITSCYDCNRGKGATELNLIPEATSDKTERMKLALKQYNEFKKILQKREDLINDEIDEVEEIYNNNFEGWIFSDKFRLSVRRFIKILGIVEVKKVMDFSCIRINDRDKVLKYFCGVCWNKINEL